MVEPCYLLIQPKRGICEFCEDNPTTNQRLEWYDYKSRYTKAYENHILFALVNSTICDVSIKENLGYDAIDAVKHIASDAPDVLREICNIVRSICKQVQAQPVILAELLDETPTKYAEALKGFGFTHILNSTFGSIYSKKARGKKKELSDSWNTSDWLLHEIGNLQTKLTYE